MRSLNLNVLGNTLELNQENNKISIRSNNLQELITLSKEVISPLIKDNITLPFYFFSSTKFNSFREDVVEKEMLSLFTSYKLFGSLLNADGTHVLDLISFRSNLLTSSNHGKFNSMRDFNEAVIKSGGLPMNPVVFIIGDLSYLLEFCNEALNELIASSTRLGIYIICFDYNTSLPEMNNSEIYGSIGTVLDLELKPQLSYFKSTINK